jgi:tetratricopeptide (TPR) repeat protein
VSNLANVYYATGQNDKALRLFEQTRAMMESKLGAEHPDTLAGMNNLANAYYATDQLGKAIALHEETTKRRTRVLGPGHPDTLASINNLAVAYQAAGQLEKALPLYEETLERRRATLGGEHPDTLQSMSNLASAYCADGRVGKAVGIFEQVYSVMKRKLGAEHPDTLASMNNLANAYRVTDQLDKALPLFEEAARGMENRRFQHTFAPAILGATIAAYEKASRFDQAERWRRKWLAHIQATAGADSLESAEQLAGLGQNLANQKKWPEAEALLREALTIRQKQEPNDWKTFDTMSLLGQVLAGQKQYADAERLLLAGHEGLTRQQDAIPAQERAARLEQAARRLAELYTAWGKPDQARKWQPEAADQQP